MTLAPVKFSKLPSAGNSVNLALVIIVATYQANAEALCENTAAESLCYKTLLTDSALKEAEDKQLLKTAVRRPRQGGLRKGTVYEVLKPIVVYRVWDRDKEHTKFGPWWTFEKPAMSRTDYQTTYGICPELAALDMVNKCSLKKGTKIVVGFGQSVKCENQVLQPTSYVQIFVQNVANSGPRQKIYVYDCSESPWPYR